MTYVNLKLNERAVLVRDGRPERALGPGAYHFWRTCEVVRWNTDEPTFAAHAAVLGVIPADWFATVAVPPGAYGLVRRDGSPVELLPPGVHRVWTVEKDVATQVVPDTEPLPPLTDDLRASIPARELLETQVEFAARAVLFRDGVPVRVLPPGRHAFWGRSLRVAAWNTDDLVFEASPEALALFPEGWCTTIELAPHQRAVVMKDAKPRKFLRPGVHRVWTVHPGVGVRVLDVHAEAPELTDELRAVIPAGELVEVQVRQFERGLKYVQGRFEGVLEPGRYTFWTHPEAHVVVAVVDTRVQTLKVEGQELMTRDKVTLRLTLTAEYAPADAPTTAHAVADVKESLYLAVQLAAREFVAGVTLDELLEAREGLTRFLEAQVVPRAETFGVKVLRVGVKDIILPGEMKSLLNKVIEAEKAAAANVILRREDAAATRNMANTARVIAENPVLMRLKELETLKEVADRIDEVKLVMGVDGLKGLLPSAIGVTAE